MRKKDMHSRQMGRQGFTMMELMVVMAMSAIVLTAIVGLFSGLTRSYTTESARTTAQQDLRAAMDLMVMEIREAGLDPTGDLDSKVAHVKNGFIKKGVDGSGNETTGTDLDEADIEFVADLDYNGKLNATTEQFRYAIADGKLLRLMGGKKPEDSDADDVLLSNVIANTATDPDGASGAKMPVFAYYDEDNKRTTKIKDIRVVAITLTIEEPAGRDGKITRTLTQRVRLRNSN